MNPKQAWQAWRAASRLQKGIAMLKEMKAGTEPVMVGEIVRGVAALLAVFGVAQLDEAQVQALIVVGAMVASWVISRKIRDQVTPETVAQRRVWEAVDATKQALSVEARPRRVPTARKGGRR